MSRQRRHGSSVEAGPPAHARQPTRDLKDHLLLELTAKSLHCTN